MAVNFYLEKRLSKQGEAPIRCSITIQGKRLVTTTGYSISPEFWNVDGQKVLLSASGKPVENAKGIRAKVINAHLKRIDSYFSDLENSLVNNEDEITDIKSIFNKEFGRQGHSTGTDGEELVKDFFYYYDEFTQEMGKQNDWTHATRGKFNALKNHIVDFSKDIKFETFNEKGLIDFIEFLRNNLDMKNSTIGKQLGFLKWFLRWADNKGYNKETAYRSFFPKLKATEKTVVFFDWDDLIKIYEYDLKKSSVFPDHIKITTIKTADSLKIELNKYSKGILKKYEKQIFPHDGALPVLSNQRMNEYLKEMAEIMGFNEPITITSYKGNQRIDEVYPKWQMIGTHTGRRTFICNALMLGISPQIVMKWTGHSDYKAMKPYIDIADRAKADAMKLFDK